jgi:hypothetical protein
MITARIIEVNKEFSLPDNCSLLSVHFNILQDGEVVAERRSGFPIDTPQETIVAELRKYCTMYEQDHALAAGAEAQAEAEAGANEVINNLAGLDINPADEG